jgi:hypothetical protein
MKYQIISGLKEPIGRPIKRTSLDDLIELAREMKVGDAVPLTLSESQTFRVILNALGYRCLTDGYRCEVPGKILTFKLSK